MCTAFGEMACGCLIVTVRLAVHYLLMCSCGFVFLENQNHSLKLHSGQVLWMEMRLIDFGDASNPCTEEFS